MNGPSASAAVKADVDVKPRRSQVVLVALVVFAVISLLCAAALLAWSIAGWGWFMGLAALSLVAVLFGWFRSQSDIDMEGSHPTSFTTPSGVTVATDSRLLRSPDGVASLIQSAEGILHRQPLPEPDGMVDKDFIPILKSKDLAVTRINEINKNTQQLTNQLCDALGLSQGGHHQLHEITQDQQSPNADPAAETNVPMSSNMPEKGN